MLKKDNIEYFSNTRNVDCLYLSRIFYVRNKNILKIQNFNIICKTRSDGYVGVAIIIYNIILTRTPEIGQGLERILSCGARKPEQT